MFCIGIVDGTYDNRLHVCGCDCSIPIKAKHIDDFITPPCRPTEYNTIYDWWTKLSNTMV